MWNSLSDIRYILTYESSRGFGDTELYSDTNLDKELAFRQARNLSYLGYYSFVKVFDCAIGAYIFEGVK